METKKRFSLLGLSAFLLTFLTSTAFGSSNSGSQINTAEISADTLAAVPSCLHYEIEGLCFWLRCSWHGCWIETTLKVSEYLPDLTMSVFDQAGSNPWLLPNETLDKAGLVSAEVQTSTLTGDAYGFGSASDLAGHHTSDDRLKEVDVLGNPVAKLFQPPVFIPSNSEPLLPYFQSMLDAASWRSGLTEMFYPGSVVPGVHDIGQFPYNVWGSLYPRTGFVDTDDDAKAGAVIAQRSASIITQIDQPHVYYPLSETCGSHCKAYSAVENDATTIQWQMVYPIASTSCNIFGVNYLGHLMPWGSDAAEVGQGSYVWVMWHHYEGCIQGHGSYLGST